MLSAYHTNKHIDRCRLSIAIARYRPKREREREIDEERELPNGFPLDSFEKLLESVFESAKCSGVDIRVSLGLYSLSLFLHITNFLCTIYSLSLTLFY